MCRVHEATARRCTRSGQCRGKSSATTKEFERRFQNNPSTPQDNPLVCDGPSRVQDRMTVRVTCTVFMCTVFVVLTKPRPTQCRDGKWRPPTNLFSSAPESRLSTHETHGVRNDVVFGHFTQFGCRSIIRDQHEGLAEHSWMAVDGLLGSRGRVCARATAMCHIS
jgi:hypothetical protein